MNKNMIVSLSVAMLLVLNACSALVGVDNPTITPTATIDTQAAINATLTAKAPVSPAIDSNATIVAGVNATLTAVGSNPTSNAPAATACPKVNGQGWPLVGEGDAGCVYLQPTSTIEATAGYLAKLDGVTMPFPLIKENMDVGDALKTSLVYAKDAFNACFVGIIMPGKNLDFESAVITGKFIQTNAALADVVLAGNELAAITGCSNNLFVGDTAAPAGWSKDFVSGWTMKTWDYLETPIDAGKWIPFSVSLSDTPIWTAPANSPMYCQLWNGDDAKHLYHFFLEAGKTITTIVLDKSGKEVSRLNLQGTCWTMDMSKDLFTILSRATQMSEVEVANRDKDANGVKPIIAMMYVGDSTTLLGDWTVTFLTGWSGK